MYTEYCKNRTKDLINELKEAARGAYIQPVRKACGLLMGESDETAYNKVSRSRAYGVYQLLSRTRAHIYPHDSIVGSMRGLWEEVEPTELTSAIQVCERYGDRCFGTNSDHFAPDYQTIVTEGIPATLARIRASQKVYVQDAEKRSYLEDMYIAYSGLLALCRSYCDKAEALMNHKGYDKDELIQIKKDCNALTQGAPESFRQALQLVWFCHLSFNMEGRYAMALGRMDQYLYPFFIHDIEAGILDEGQATELLSNAFAKLFERHVFTGGDDVVNICVGGSAVDGRCQVNRLSYCILHAVDTVHLPGPNLSARITADTPDEFLDDCLRVIGTGLGYPALMNDQVILEALRKYGYSEEDCHDFCMVGCIENFITGRQPPWSDGRFDTPRFFEYLFNNGKAIRFPEDGLDTGDIATIGSMDELMLRMETQLRVGVAAYVEQFLAYNTIEKPELYTSPFLSCFCRDCIGRGTDINMGGALYPSVHGAALMGVGTMCDSLAAIEKVVFIDKAASLTDIRDAMLANFQGFSDLKKKLLDAPKYGNNDPLVDKYAVWFVEFLSNEFSHYKTPDGGGIYVAMAANTSNIYAGEIISATPDGRLAGEPLSDAASPTYGRDQKGVTSTLLSVTKPDYSKVACGTVLNQKFSPIMFSEEKRPRLLSLIRTYFKLGGQEIQINATSRKILKDAMINPQNYPTMVVRVSGFSAIYVTLPQSVQQDILMRTQQDE